MLSDAFAGLYFQSPWLRCRPLQGERSLQSPLSPTVLPFTCRNSRSADR